MFSKWEQSNRFCLFVFSIFTNPTVEITISYIIVRNLLTFVSISKELNIAYTKESYYDKNTHIYK